MLGGSGQDLDKTGWAPSFGVIENTNDQATIKNGSGVQICAPAEQLRAISVWGVTVHDVQVRVMDVGLRRIPHPQQGGLVLLVQRAGGINARMDIDAVGIDMKQG